MLARSRKAVVLSFILVFVLVVPAVMAANPHFVGQVKIKDLGTQVNVQGSIAGLGNENIDVLVEATGTASVECTNPGGNVAPGQDTAVTASGSETDIKVKNGRANFDVTTDAPENPSGADVCPNAKWSATIVDVDFTSVTVTVYQPSGSMIIVLQETFTP